MSRCALPVFLFLGHVAIVTALTAVLVVRTGSFRVPLASAQFGARPVAASPSDGPRPTAEALLGPPEGKEPSAAQDDTSLPPPPDDGAPDAAVASGPALQPPPDDQVAALQRLVAQSRQENEQLGLIDNQLAAQRQRAADDESRRESEARQKVARRAATMAALAALRRAEALLASGSSDGVDDQLVSAGAALSGRTRVDVQAARQALARGDLFQAAEYLAAAGAERRARRTGP
jgi:hypothetical protein